MLRACWPPCVARPGGEARSGGVLRGPRLWGWTQRSMLGPGSLSPGDPRWDPGGSTGLFPVRCGSLAGEEGGHTPTGSPPR